MSKEKVIINNQSINFLEMSKQFNRFIFNYFSILMLIVSMNVAQECFAVDLDEEDEISGLEEQMDSMESYYGKPHIEFGERGLPSRGEIVELKLYKSPEVWGIDDPHYFKITTRKEQVTYHEIKTPEIVIPIFGWKLPIPFIGYEVNNNFEHKNLPDAAKKHFESPGIKRNTTTAKTTPAKTTTAKTIALQHSRIKDKTSSRIAAENRAKAKRIEAKRTVVKKQASELASKAQKAEKNRFATVKAENKAIEEDKEAEEEAEARKEHFN
jgi:hypothetical protein